MNQILSRTPPHCHHSCPLYLVHKITNYSRVRLSRLMRRRQGFEFEFEFEFLSITRTLSLPLKVTLCFRLPEVLLDIKEMEQFYVVSVRQNV
eukprot:m.229516 g.229516  ORF g.229516 m.229516 type:complete len:92 (-) comp13884_c0_seq2:69-344(-)